MKEVTVMMSRLFNQLFLVFASLVCYSTPLAYASISEFKISSQQCALGAINELPCPEFLLSTGDSRELSVLEQSQQSLGSLEGIWLLDRPAIPPLDIRSLHLSGPSRNRVDLVFFSDGCTSFPTHLFRYTS
jgi:hypothetical protein